MVNPSSVRRATVSLSNVKTSSLRFEHLCFSFRFECFSLKHHKSQTKISLKKSGDFQETFSKKKTIFSIKQMKPKQFFFVYRYLDVLAIACIAMKFYCNLSMLVRTSAVVHLLLAHLLLWFLLQHIFSLRYAFVPALIVRFLPSLPDRCLLHCSGRAARHRSLRCIFLLSLLLFFFFLLPPLNRIILSLFIFVPLCLCNWRIFPRFFFFFLNESQKNIRNFHAFKISQEARTHSPSRRKKRKSEKPIAVIK